MVLSVFTLCNVLLVYFSVVSHDIQSNHLTSDTNEIVVVITYQTYYSSDSSVLIADKDRIA